MCKPSIPGYVLVKEIGAGASAIVFKAHKQVDTSRLLNAHNYRLIRRTPETL